MKQLSLLALATVCSVGLVACDTSRVTEPANAESTPLFVKANSTTSTVVVPLSGTTANPCGEGTISYSGSIAITGSVTAKSKTVTVAGSINAENLLIKMGDADYKADPTTTSFEETFARSTTTYTVPVTMAFASDDPDAPTYTVSATLTITVSGNGQITGVAVASLTCKSTSL